MNIDFIQGIITYPTSGPLQRFLTQTGGYISLSTADGRVDATFAHGTENYLHTESVTTQNAWGPIDSDTDAWLYWDINTLTAQRTFGVTYVQPVYGSTAPISPVEDLHWFDTTNKLMRVYRSGVWVTKIRLFACKYNTGVFTPMGDGNSAKPFAGTQVGITAPGITTGRIVVDITGTPIRRNTGEMFTTEDEFFVNGSPVNTIRLEANVLNATAKESVAKFQVVKYTEFGKINLSTYNDIETTMIAMAMEDFNSGDSGTLCAQGVITNPAWNWSVVGSPLWVHGSIPGLLVEYDPHVSDAATYKVGKAPVGRVISRTSIFFDQGLGGKGDKGEAGSANVPLATTTVFGISKLSVDAANVDNPIVVGDNDYRNFNDRYPLPHNQAATTITTVPVGIINGPNVQSNLQIINDSFVKKAGDTMTGYLNLHADPATSLQAATKHYVDTRTLDDLADVTINNPVVDNVLKYNGTEWVNAPDGGSSGGDSLWMLSTRTDDINWIPASQQQTIVDLDDNPYNYATLDVSNVRATLCPTDLPIFNFTLWNTSGDQHTISLQHPHPEQLTTLQDVVNYINSECAGTFTASLEWPQPDQFNVVIDLIDPQWNDGCSASLGPIEASCNELSSSLFSYTYDNYTSLTQVVMHIQGQAGAYNGNPPLDLDQLLTTLVTINIDGTIYDTKLFVYDRHFYSVIDLINANWKSRNIKAKITSFASDNESGIAVTSTDPTVSSLVITTADNVFKYYPYGTTGLLKPAIAGVPVGQVIIDPVLTPVPTTPTTKETYIPLHTEIISDEPIIDADNWFANIGYDVDLVNVGVVGQGIVGVGRPGYSTPNSALLANRDVVYNAMIQQTYQPQGMGLGQLKPNVVVESRYKDNQTFNESGQLITTVPYIGRISFAPCIDTDDVTFENVQTVNTSVLVGNNNGAVYVITDVQGSIVVSRSPNNYYIPAATIVTALDPDLTQVLWSTFVAQPNGTPPVRDGISIDYNNDLYVASLNSVYSPAPDYHSPDSNDIHTMVSKINHTNGTVLWSQLYTVGVDSGVVLGAETKPTVHLGVSGDNSTVAVGVFNKVFWVSGSNGTVIDGISFEPSHNNTTMINNAYWITDCVMHRSTNQTFVVFNAYQFTNENIVLFEISPQREVIKQVGLGTTFKFIYEPWNSSLYGSMEIQPIKLAVDTNAVYAMYMPYVNTDSEGFNNLYSDKSIRFTSLNSSTLARNYSLDVSNQILAFPQGNNIDSTVTQAMTSPFNAMASLSVTDDTLVFGYPMIVAGNNSYMADLPKKNGLYGVIGSFNKTTPPVVNTSEYIWDDTTNHALYTLTTPSSGQYASFTPTILNQSSPALIDFVPLVIPLSNSNTIYVGEETTNTRFTTLIHLLPPIIGDVHPSLRVKNVATVGQLQLGDLFPPPQSDVGSVGDGKGMIRASSDGLYYCTGDFDGQTSIWKQVQYTTPGIPRLVPGPIVAGYNSYSSLKGSATDQVGDIYVLGPHILQCTVPYDGSSQIWFLANKPDYSGSISSNVSITTRYIDSNTQVLDTLTYQVSVSVPTQPVTFNGYYSPHPTHGTTIFTAICRQAKWFSLVNLRVRCDIPASSNGVSFDVMVNGSTLSYVYFNAGQTNPSSITSNGMWVYDGDYISIVCTNYDSTIAGLAISLTLY